MSHIKLFEQFLLEQANVDVLRNIVDLITGIFKDAKANNRIKYVTSFNKAMSNWDAPGWSKEGNFHRKLWSCPKIDGDLFALEYDNRKTETTSSQLIMLNNKELVEMVHVTNIRSREQFNFPSLSEDRILFISNKPLDKNIIDQIIPDEISGAQKNDIYTCKKVLVEDNSDKLKTYKSNICYSHNGNVSGPDIKVYSMIYRFDVAKSSGDAVTFEQAKDLPEMKALLNKYPVQIISTDKQIKNGTFVFGIDKKHLVGSESVSIQKWGANSQKYIETVVNDDCQWLHDSFTITNSGYIRKLPTFDIHWGDRASVIGTFNTSNIEGWKTALETIDKQLDKYISSLIKRGYKVWVTPEEKHEYRGYIMKRRFGI